MKKMGGREGERERERVRELRGGGIARKRRRVDREPLSLSFCGTNDVIKKTGRETIKQRRRAIKRSYSLFLAGIPQRKAAGTKENAK
jgi:hypothetical protein